MRLRAALWWASLGFGVTGACLWVRLYAEVPFVAGAICLAIAAALAGLGSSLSGGRKVTPNRWALSAVVAACAAALPLVCAELRVVAGIVALGATTAMFRPKRAAGLGAGILASGLQSLLLVGATSLYARFAAPCHEAPALRALDSGIAWILGLGTATVGREVILPAGSRFAPVVPSWDQFGLVFGILIVLGVVGFALLTRGSRGLGRVAARSVGLVTAYLIVRHVLLLLVALELERPSVFWLPSTTFATIAPLALLVPRVAGVRAAWDAAALIERGTISRRRAWLISVAALLGTLSVSLSLLLAPAGARASGRVLFDEAHGEWETTAREMDTEWYGMASTYNYDSLYRWLDGYYETGRVSQQVDQADLERGDVLVLKTPSIPYSPDEIHAIVEHVRRGGGLLVIGDHTNVFGTTTVLNPVLAPFGLRLGYDATYRLRDGGFTTYEPRNAIDPVFQHVPRFDFLTSCSLHGGLFALPIICDGRILASAADYSTRNFFPEGRMTLASTFGMFLQAAAVEAGRGRVVAFTDSTCFSNFSLHMDGYTGFLLGTMEYLRRENPLPGWRSFAAVAGILCATVGLASGISVRRRAVLTIGLVGVLLGLATATAATAAWHRAAYPTPIPRHDISYVYFDVSASRARISPQPSMTDPLGTRGAFGTFFTWTQRIGLVPSLVSARTSLAGARPYVVINPEGVPSPSRDRIVDYVRSKGGSLVLLGDPVWDREGLDEYCALFGLTVVRAQSDSLVLSAGTTVQTEISPAQTVFISVASAGAGRVVLLSDSVAFSDLALGGGFAMPSTIQRRLYDLEFWLFGTLLASPP